MRIRSDDFMNAFMLDIRDTTAQLKECARIAMREALEEARKAREEEAKRQRREKVVSIFSELAKGPQPTKEEFTKILDIIGIYYLQTGILKEV